MTRLLVSVRDAAEARIALRSGADLIDIKQPDRGPLGAPDPATVHAVLDALASEVPVSVALGELLQWDQCPLNGGVPDTVAYAKLALAGCGRRGDWAARWKAAVSCVPRQVARVAVIYADWEKADSPTPEAILAEAGALGCRAILVDTFDKSSGSVVTVWAGQQWTDIVESAHRLGMMAVLAGSLSPETIPRVLPARPDYVGVRGAVCRGGRLGPLDGDAVRRLAGLLGRPVCPERGRFA
jgi:(5-formylfuran-3-yl)methyl phosphate synthase